MLHQAFHYDLRVSEPRDCYAWVQPNLPTIRLSNVAAQCRSIIRENPGGIPLLIQSSTRLF